MKVTRKLRKILIKRIKQGDYENRVGIYKMKSKGFPAYWMIWYKAGKSFTIITSLMDTHGACIDLPIGKWDEWLIKRALKKYCK